MLNLALLSYWHVHAKDYEREAIANPGTEISVVWDEDVDRGSAKRRGSARRYEPDLQAVLSDPSIDGVIVTTATSEHERMPTAAARAGKHIFTEKVIAATTSGARAVLDAVDRAGVTMMVCLPRLSNGYTRALDGMLERGELGTIGYFRMRVGHNGAVGAIRIRMDGCHRSSIASPKPKEALIDLGRTRSIWHGTWLGCRNPSAGRTDTSRAGRLRTMRW
ncbi:MAG: Gfo/Idh/MocA family oxidoreductase [Thermomicrobiales bacterium]